jgi:hypothetical protein
VSESTEKFTQALMELTEVMRPVIEATEGYRAQLLASGWSPAAAETMSVEFHRLVLAQIMGGLAKGKR